MNNATAARLYFLFALLLCTLAWKVCSTTVSQLVHIQAERTAQLEKALADN